jgi:hypothetical protein
MRTALLVILLGLPSAAFADNLVGDPGAPFPGFIDLPRSTAMGGAFSAIASSNDALLVNPAGLPQFRRYHFELDGALDAHFPAQGVMASIVDSATAPVATGLLWSRWGSGQPAGRGEGWSIGFSYAGILGNGLFAGGTTKYIRYHTPEGLVEKWAEDVGVLSKRGSFSWAIAFQNLSFDRIPLFPATGTAGVAWGNDADWHLALDYKADLSDTSNIKSSGAFGGELLVDQNIALRGGLRHDFSNDIWWVSAGVGILTSGGGLQIAWRRRVTGPFDQIFEAGLTLYLE